MSNKVIPNNMSRVIDDGEISQKVRKELVNWRNDNIARSCNDYSKMATWELVSTCNQL